MTSKPARTSKNDAKPKKGVDLLLNVTFEKGFHFHIALGKYTGITANSLGEFADKLQIVPVESVVFHFHRDDFQKWIRNVIGDEVLARRLDQLRTWPSWSSDENLRKELVKTVKKRLDDLKPNQ
ncbi:MAG TPA: DUF5752 family protein [Candidatus Nanoarchaeia archaeon]|nr:DUF5752 family protein [Candidatus Nanoarchaeia archaeon]